MRLRKTVDIRAATRISLAALIAAFATQPLIAQSANTAIGTADARAHELWRRSMSDNAPTTEGCAQAAYPNLVWERVACTVVPPRFPTVPRAGTSATGAPSVVGNGHDWVLVANGLLTQAVGLFLNVTNVKSEKGVGVASFGGGGVLGPNEYSLQLNTNRNGTTSVCAGHSGCTVWQQYLYTTDTPAKGNAAVFIQYWLLNWGKTACPKGFANSGGSCVKNSAGVVTPNMKITQLGSLQLEAKAAPGGKDAVLFSNGTKIYSVTANDSVLKLGMVWTQAEFNVVGNGDGSRAVFNTGASTDVAIEIVDGSTAAPHCLRNAGSTGETNNFNLGPCGVAAATGGVNPAMEFFEAN